MENSIKGLLFLVGGAVFWIMMSAMGAVATLATGERDLVFYGLMWLGFVLMIGGPVVYWIVVPIRNRRKSREH